MKPGAFVYVADSAFVTQANLEKAQAANTKFLTRLPATYDECSRATQKAVDADDWVELGSLAEMVPPQKRPVAVYNVYETTVTFTTVNIAPLWCIARRMTNGAISASIVCWIKSATSWRRCAKRILQSFDQQCKEAQSGDNCLHAKACYRYELHAEKQPSV